jgi:ATP-dependent RNA helicase DDX27
MMTTLAQYTNIRAALIVGGAKNVNAQAAELRARPDVVVATPGRLLDHVTNSAGVTLDDVEFLVLDEADRLLDLGFQDEVHELIRACPSERQTMLFSATMTTKVDDLVKLSLKRPVRVKVSDKRKSGSAEVEVAPRLEQEFVRVRSGNEGVNREGMLLALLTRTFTTRTIVFFDTKAAAHRLMILCGLCGIKCAELHGNLTQMQRLTALEQFRKGKVDVLLATDLAARGLDIDRLKTVINFEMPNQVETYVHRIGRTARAGRHGKSCTLIGEGRRHLMKEVIKDAEEKSGRDAGKSGVIRSRTIPPAVVAHFVAKIESLEPHVEEVLQAEAVARLDRLAEMEAMRAKNIIEHSKDIMSRPQREWFASNKQKQSLKEATAEKQKMIAENAGTGTHRMTRKKRRAREAKEELQRYQEEVQQEREESGKQPKKFLTDKSIKSSARAQKKKMEKENRTSGLMSVHDEDQEHMAKQREREKKQTKRKGAFASDAIGDSSLFDDEKVSYAKKPKTETIRQSSYQFTEFNPDNPKRKGKKKSVHAFKSKSKYKRRK